MGTAVILAVLTLPADPLAAELLRFPTLTECNDAVNFNEKFMEGLRARRAWDRSTRWEAYAEAESSIGYRRRTWYSLKAARNRDLRECWRWSRLADLREQLGEEDFWAGRMPLPVPLFACYGE